MIYRLQLLFCHIRILVYIFTDRRNALLHGGRILRDCSVCKRIRSLVVTVRAVCHKICEFIFHAVIVGNQIVIICLVFLIDIFLEIIQITV